jgi:hypothetical protein
MKKLSLVLLTLLATAAIFAQGGQPTPSASASRYHVYRTTATEPSSGLAKIKAMVARLKADGDDNRRMPAKEFDALSFQQKFTYTMIHAEDMAQDCNEMPVIIDEDKKIFAYPAAAFDDQAAWSDQQRAFLHKNRTRVISMLRSTIKQKNRVGVNFKQAIVELDAYELIPDLVAVYNKTKKDQDIISVLMILMKDGKFGPFLASSTYTKLYGEGANYQAYDVANDANRKLMIGRAMAYYKQRTG